MNLLLRTWQWQQGYTLKVAMSIKLKRLTCSTFNPLEVVTKGFQGLLLALSMNISFNPSRSNLLAQTPCLSWFANLQTSAVLRLPKLPYRSWTISKAGDGQRKRGLELEIQHKLHFKTVTGLQRVASERFLQLSSTCWSFHASPPPFSSIS